MYILGNWEYNGEPNRQNLNSPETQTSVGKRVAIYITQMEKPTIGSAQTQKSTDKVASKGEQGKTEKQAGATWRRGRRSRLEDHFPSQRSLVSLSLCPKSYIHTQELTLSQHQSSDIGNGSIDKAPLPWSLRGHLSFPLLALGMAVIWPIKWGNGEVQECLFIAFPSLFIPASLNFLQDLTQLSLTPGIYPHPLSQHSLSLVMC